MIKLIMPFLMYLTVKQRNSTKKTERERDFNRINAPSMKLDTSEIDKCNRNFTEFELELAIAQLKI